MSKIFSITLLSILVFSIDTVKAYNIYNESTQNLNVSVSPQCFSCYSGTIAAGAYASCPGNSGGCNQSYNICVQTGSSNANQYLCSPAKVTNHGYAEIYNVVGDCSNTNGCTLNIKIHDNDDNLIYDGPGNSYAYP